jgi:hypothetical protein
MNRPLAQLVQGLLAVGSGLHGDTTRLDHFREACSLILVVIRQKKADFGR